jgi:integrase
VHGIERRVDQLVQARDRFVVFGVGEVLPDACELRADHIRERVGALVDVVQDGRGIWGNRGTARARAAPPLHRDQPVRRSQAPEEGPQASPDQDHALTDRQVLALANAIDVQCRLAVLLDAYTGLRAGEPWALRRDDIDLSRGTLTVDEAQSEVTAEAAEQVSESGRLTDSYIVKGTKTDQTRVLTLPKFLKAELAEHLRSRSAATMPARSSSSRPRERRSGRTTFTSAPTSPQPGPPSRRT